MSDPVFEAPGSRQGKCAGAGPATMLAHSGPDGQPHELRQHLQAVAALAENFAAATGARHWAHLAGLWHDLGKFRPGFQRYIRQVNSSEAHIEGRLPASSDKTHSAAGALHALRTFEQRFGRDGAVLGRVLAYVIAGHHAGLADWTASLDQRLLGAEPNPAQREYREAIEAGTGAAPDLLPLPAAFDLRTACAAIPGVRGGAVNPLAWSLWVRMLFSCLVDADFLDTEAFLDGARAQHRHGFEPIERYGERLELHLAAQAADVRAQGRDGDALMQARASVLRQCRQKATGAPGVYSLTVPTGGGKTLSSLAFALRHAQAHGKRRVIYAIPYTSIIEQTADVFAGIFGDGAVLEHHSQASDGDDDDGAHETARSRLACENWDAPLIVTTNVQLFESLFAARTSRCRKLHHIAGSVIVLDEAQLLPPEFLQPILDALHVLVAHYGVTVLLCTATQPALTDSRRFDPRQNLRGLPAPTPIIDDEAALFSALERVRVEWPTDLHTPLSTDDLVQRLGSHDCVLAIVNTRRDAAEIVAALDAATGEPTLHLSAAMCGQHRADVIREIRARLADRRAGRDTRPLRVVSTQLVEAGVDIDFPVVFRAFAGLDSIAQAAGRCNREALLPGGARGLVVVFVRAIPKTLTALGAGAQATRSTLAAGFANALAPAAYAHYFPRYYDGYPSRDRHAVVAALANDGDFAFSFRTAARRFRLIDDKAQAPVIVRYRSPHPAARDIDALLGKLRKDGPDRWLLRALQRHMVTARRAQLDVWQARGDVREIQPGLYELIDELRYDARRGLLDEGRPLDAGNLIQ